MCKCVIVIKCHIYWVWRDLKIFDRIPKNQHFDKTWFSWTKPGSSRGTGNFNGFWCSRYIYIYIRRPQREQGECVGEKVSFRHCRFPRSTLGPLQPFARQHPCPPAPFAAFRSPSAILWPCAGHLQKFYWVQKATLGSSLALNVSRRPWPPFATQHPGPPAFKFAAFW